MPAFPSIDLTDADLTPVVRSAARARRTVSQAIESPGESARDVATATTQTAIGLGVLAWQRLQVRRQEIARALRS